MRLTTFCLLVSTLFVACVEDPIQESNLHVTCSGENISGNQFHEGTQSFFNAKCRTDDYSRTGSYGFKLSEVQQYGPSLRIDSIKQGDVVYASVYRKKGSARGKLVIASKDEVQYESNEISLEEKVEWELVKCSFVAKRDYEYVTVYLWNPLKEAAYLDDLSIDCFRNNKKPGGISEKDIL